MFYSSLSDTFLAVVTASTSVGSSNRAFAAGPGTEPISRILAVEFVSLTSAAYDTDTPAGGHGADAGGSGDYYEESEGNARRPGELDHPCSGIAKILRSGTFYFSAGERSFDLSTRLEARLARVRASAKGKGAARADVGADEDEALDVDERFLWNRFLVAPLLSFRASLPAPMREVLDLSSFCILAIQGFVGVHDINLAGQPATISLISRLGWKRAGTRYNVRGIDDEGGVASKYSFEAFDPSCRHSSGSVGS